MTSTPTKTLSYAVGGLLVITLLIGGYIWFVRTSPSAMPLERVTIANALYAGTCPILTAQEQKYFENEGVAVTIQFHTSGKAALDATLQGKADFGTAADIPIMFAAMKNQPVSVIASMFKSQKDNGIVARKDKVVAPAELKGKRIGVTLGTSGHFVLDSFLNRQRLSATDVTVRDLKPEEMASALAKGDIDAASTWEPYLGGLREQLGGNSTMFSSEGIYDLVYNIVATRDYIAGHPETVKKVLRALIQGAQFCETTPDISRELLANAMKTDATKFKNLWPSYRFSIVLDQGLLLALEDETRWAIKNKLTDRTRIPNYLNYLHLDGLQAVAPSAVTVIH